MNIKELAMNRTGWVTAWGVLLGAGFCVEPVPGQYILDNPAVVPAAPVVVRSAPIIVQRPIFPRLTPVLTPPAAIYAPSAPVVVQRVPVSTPVVGQPITLPPAASQTVWYSAPGTTMAPAVAPATVVYQPVVGAPLTTRLYVGSGLVGQPKVYVQGQPLRNAVRFLSP
jgi:hypothetical protein